MTEEEVQKKIEMRIAMAMVKLRRDRMTEEEVQKKIEIAGAVGAFVGFASGVGLMALVGIIF